MRIRIWQLLGFVGAVVLTLNQSAADVVVSYDFTASPGNQAFEAADSTIANLVASDLSRGAGLTVAAGEGSINASAWSTASADLTDYYGFSLTPALGFVLDLDRISFAERRSGTGITTFEIRSSLDGFGSAIGGTLTVVPDNTNTRNQSFALGSEFSGLTSQVEFRIYGYAAEASGGTWRLANYTGSEGSIGGLTVDGSIAAVPEASSFLFGGLIATAVGLRYAGRRLRGARA